LNKDILKLAIPNIISNVSVPLVGLADLAILGHSGHISYLGGAVLGGMVFNFLYWNFAFLRMGTSGITAQAFGAKDTEKQALTLFRSLSIGFIAAVLIIMLQIPIEKIAFYLIDGTEAVKAEARNYFYIRIYAAPATICIYALTGWYIGMQNSILPMFIAILINISNVLLNYYFVFVKGLNTEGVALGTLIAQYIGLLASIAGLAFFYRAHFKYFIIKQILKLSDLKDFMQVNSHIFIRTFCVIAVMTFFTSKSAGFSNEVLAINAVLLQFFLLFSYFIDGFAFAAEALTGRFVGENNKQKLQQSMKLIIKWGLFLSIAVSVVFIIADENIVKMMTDDVGVQQGSNEYIWWLKLIPIAGFMAFVWDGIYIGATASRYMMYSLVVASSIFFIAYFSFNNIIGNHALWLAFYGYLISRGLYQTLYLKKAILTKI